MPRGKFSRTNIFVCQTASAIAFVLILGDFLTCILKMLNIYYAVEKQISVSVIQMDKPFVSLCECGRACVYPKN